MAINWYDAAVNAEGVLLDGGSLKLYTGSQPAEDAAESGDTLLGTVTFNATAFAGSDDGTADANSMTGSDAVASGTAGWFEMFESGGTAVGTGVVGVSGSGADLILNETSITEGAPISISSFTLPG